MEIYECNELKIIKDIMVWLITSEKCELMAGLYGQPAPAASMMNYLKKNTVQSTYKSTHISRGPSSIPSVLPSTLLAPLSFFFYNLVSKNNAHSNKENFWSVKTIWVSGFVASVL